LTFYRSSPLAKNIVVVALAKLFVCLSYVGRGVVVFERSDSYQSFYNEGTGHAGSTQTQSFKVYRFYIFLSRG
jgi:hypothetical protein